MRNKSYTDRATDTAERLHQNVKNMPMTSIALAGLVGAGAMALISMMGRKNSLDNTQDI
jgi:hypothetical protein